MLVDAVGTLGVAGFLELGRASSIWAPSYSVWWST
jgi:hypothetical protein